MKIRDKTIGGTGDLRQNLVIAPYIYGSRTFNSFDECVRSPTRKNSCTRSKPNPIRSHPSRSVSIRARSNSNAMRSDAGSAPIRHGSKQNRKKMPKLVILPSARLPRAFRVPSGTAPFGCAQFRPGSAATRLGSVPFRLGSDSFWRGSALLGTGSARLRFVNELFFLSDFF